ncbi:P-loop containing nucleoside triphosphate hydrolase protein [Phaeosphaeriaceae sp. PMI808]|nr:P-loop containing nucleoside triphosphate hydrolase protein [Phaeosphaeriaceae sp. PMI808]
MPTCSPSLDRAFGPRVDHCRRSFDFTQLFEECFFIITPSVLLLIAATVRTALLQHVRRRLSDTSMRALKLIVISCFGSVQLTILLLRCLDSAGRIQTTIAAAAFPVIDAIAMAVLSTREHPRSIRPSYVLEVYLFFTLIFDAARARTAWLIGQDEIYSILTTTGAIVKFFILLLELRGKAGLSPEDANRSPEERSGAIGQTLLWWLVNLVRTGYSKILGLSDLYPLTNEMRSEAVGEKFARAWSKCLVNPKSALIRSLWLTLRFRLLLPIIPRIIMIALTYCQPLLIERVLLLKKDEVTEDSKNNGYGLVAAYGLVYAGIAVVSASYWFHVAKATTLVRGAIASKVYSRVNDLSIMNTDDSAAMTLMSTDVERITIGLTVMHETWANVLEVAIGIYLLQLQLGAPAYVALGVALGCAAFAVLLGSTAGQRQKIWMEAVETRISATASMLSSMKSVKMLGISTQLGAAIQKMRLDELGSATNFRILQIIMITLAYLPQTLSPVLTFAAYTLRPGTPMLGFTQMFTSLSILTILASQFTQLFQSIPALFAALACLGRIQIFLLAPDRRLDNRMSGSLLPAYSSIDFSLGGMITDLLRASPEPDTFERRLKKFTTPLPPLNERWDAVHLRDASFAWTRRRGGESQEKEEKEVLHGLTANLPANALTIVVGPVASGKSTLLKGILGEVYNTAGSVWVSSRTTAFCDQTPWLRNASVRQNILGYGLWDEEWYAAVVRACALDKDFERLPLGDQTVVGSEGIALSGGQKQRVTIARAVYARREMAVFDDVLSGLDSTTMNNVFQAVFGKDGLLRHSQTTILLATHSAHVLQYADHIIALGRNGTITEQGSFQELRSQPYGYVQELCSKIEYPDEDSDNEDLYIPSAPRPEVQQSVTVASPATARLEVPAADAPNRQMGDRKAYVHYFRATGMRNTIIFVLAELAFVTLEIVPHLWLSSWADAADNKHSRSVGYYLGIYAALQIGFLVSLFIGARHVASTMVVRSGRWLHAQLVNTVSAAPLSFFTSTDAGITLNRFSQDVHLLDSELPVSLLLLGAAALSALAQAVVVLVAAKYVAAAMVLVIGVFWLVQRTYLRTSRQLRYLDLEAKSPLYSLFLEALRGRATVRAFRWQDECQSEFLRALDDSQRPVYLLASVQHWLALVLGLITAAVAVVLVAIMVTLRDKGTTTAGLGGVALLNMMSLSTNLMSTVVTWTRLETSIGAVARIKDFMDKTPREAKPPDAIELSESWPAGGDIELKNVSVAYKEDSDRVVKDVSFTIKSGEKVAICGGSGSGKSTLISTLFRLVDPGVGGTGGEIIIDGIDVSTLPHDALRARLVALPQDPYFAPWASIRFNADPLGRATDDAITQALERVGLADALLGAAGIVGRKNGLDAQMDADMLSHGQRQLFCLARAMLKKPESGGVLVVDEATSSVDGETDKRMQRILRDEFGGPNWTWLVVAHRLETVMDFDKIAVLDRGKLVEFDGPTALLERPGGSAFQQLCMEFGLE